MTRLTKIVRACLTTKYDNSWTFVLAWLVFFVVGAILKLAEPQSWALPLLGALAAGLTVGFLVRRREFPSNGVSWAARLLLHEQCDGSAIHAAALTEQQAVIRIPFKTVFEALGRAAKRLFGRRGPEPQDPYALVTAPLRPGPPTRSARAAVEPER